MSTQSKVNKMSEQKINKTYIGAIEQIATLKKVFRENGKLQNAILESEGDTSVLARINRAFDNLAEELNSAITKEQLNEGVLDSGDEDGFMARSQLYFLAKDAINLHGMIDDRDDLEPWVHSKIVAAGEGIEAVRRYIEYREIAGGHSEPEMEPTAEPTQLPTEPNDDEKLMGSYGEGIDENFSHQVKDFGMFSKGGNAQVQNAIQYILRDFDDAAEKATNSDRDMLRMQAHEKLRDELEALSDEDGYEEAMDTEVREKSAAYLEQGIIRIMNVLDDVNEGWETLPAMPSKYVERDNLEGPFMTRSGKVVYYDPHEGSYYDPDSDHFLSYDEWKALDGDAPLRNESKSSGSAWYVEQDAKEMAEKDGHVWSRLPYGQQEDYRKKAKAKRTNEAEGEDTELKHYLCVHAKKGTTKVQASSSYDAALEAAKLWNMKSTAGIDAHLMTAEAKKTPADSPKGDPYLDFDQPDYVPPKKKVRAVNPKADSARRAHMSGRKERMIDDVNEGFKIRDKSRGYGVSDKTYKTRDEAKKAAVMHAARTGGDWEVIEEGMEFDEKRNDDLQAVAKDMFKHAKEQAKKSLKVKKS